MKTKTIIIIILAAFVLGSVAYSFKADKKEGKISCSELLLRLNENRFISSDQLAEKIISHEPQLLIVDVRQKEDFSKFSLPGSINIPLESFSSHDKINLLKKSNGNIVLVSNNGANAQSAWVFLQEIEYSQIQILKGGLNCWVKTILNPKDPGENCSSEVRGLYEFRLGASEFFAGGNEIDYTIKEEK